MSIKPRSRGGRGAALFVRLLVLLVTFYAVGVGGRSAWLRIGRTPPGMEMFQRNLERYTPLGEVLPRGARVGYATDAHAGVQVPMDEIAGQLAIAQYCLLPAVLLPGLHHDLVVGDFRNPSLVHDVRRSNGLDIAEDLGDGVYLLRPGR